MPHLATDRIARGLRWTGTALLVAGGLLVIAGIGWTTTAGALVTASVVAVVALGLPGAAAFGIALWLEHVAERIGHPAVGGTVPPVLASAAVRNPFREPLRGYAVALVAVGVAWAARAALDLIAPGQVPFITFFFAVMAAGWFGGFGPAALATAASLVITWRLYVNTTPFAASPDLGRFVILGLFVFACLGIAAITAALHAALARAQQLADELQRHKDALARTARSDPAPPPP